MSDAQPATYRRRNTIAVAECAWNVWRMREAALPIAASRVWTVPALSSLFESHTANMSLTFRERDRTDVFSAWTSARGPGSNPSITIVVSTSS